MVAPAHGAARSDAAPGEDAGGRCAPRGLHVSRAHASMAARAVVSRRRPRRCDASATNCGGRHGGRAGVSRRWSPTPTRTSGARGSTSVASADGRCAHSITLSNSASRAGGRGNMSSAGRHGRSCLEGRSGGNMASSGGTFRCGSVQLTQGVHGERRGKPYAGNPHVRFDEGPLARASRTAGWGLLHPRVRRGAAVAMWLRRIRPAIGSMYFVQHRHGVGGRQGFWLLPEG